MFPDNFNSQTVLIQNGRQVVEYEGKDYTFKDIELALAKNHAIHL